MDIPGPNPSRAYRALRNAQHCSECNNRGYTVEYEDDGCDEYGAPIMIPRRYSCWTCWRGNKWEDLRRTVGVSTYGDYDINANLSIMILKEAAENGR